MSSCTEASQSSPKPPSTRRISPVVYFASINATQAFATAAGTPVRRSGLFASTFARKVDHELVRSVSTKPGAMALTRTSGPIAAASKRVIWSKPALLTAYGIELPPTVEQAIELILTMQPLDHRSSFAH